VLATEKQTAIAPRSAVFSDADGRFAYVKNGGAWKRQPVEPG
jgi:hypothetical protein